MKELSIIDQRSEDEMDPASRKKSWIHTLLKSTIYTSLNTMLGCIRYTMQGKLNESPDDCRNAILRKLWLIYELGWDDIFSEHAPVVNQEYLAKCRRETPNYIMLTELVQIGCTLLDYDPAWMHRLNIWMKRWDKHRNDQF